MPVVAQDMGDHDGADWALDVFGPQAGWIHEGLQAEFRQFYLDTQEGIRQAEEEAEVIVPIELSFQAANGLLEAWAHVQDHQCMAGAVTLDAAMRSILYDIFVETYGCEPPEGWFG